VYAQQCVKPRRTNASKWSLVRRSACRCYLFFFAFDFECCERGLKEHSAAGRAADYG